MQLDARECQGLAEGVFAFLLPPPIHHPLFLFLLSSFRTHLVGKRGSIANFQRRTDRSIVSAVHANCFARIRCHLGAWRWVKALPNRHNRILGKRSRREEKPCRR